MSAKPAKRLSPHLSLIVQYAIEDDALPTRAQIRRWVQAVCRTLHAAAVAITVRFVDSDEGRTLNRDYRHKDYATNVLSFGYECDEDNVAGDLVVCLPMLQREAQEQHKTLEAHCAHLIVHGMLHLYGFEHEHDEHEAEQMESLERELMARLGYPDPYLDSAH